MSTKVRPIVWTAVVAASVAAGWYLRQIDTARDSDNRTAPGNYLLIAGGADDYWDLCVAGAQTYAEKVGATVDVRRPINEGEEGLKQQIDWLTTIAPGEFDGVAIGPISPDRQTTLINTLVEKSPIVTVDSDVPASRRMFHIGSSNLEAGAIAAHMVKASLPEGGKVAVLLASEEKTNAAERKRGLIETLSPWPEETEGEQAESDRATYSIVGFYLDHGDLEICRQNVRALCEEHQDIGAIVGTFGYHGPIILEELSDSGGNGQIQVVAFDEADSVLQGIDDGKVYATIVQDPFLFGVEALQMLEHVHKGHFLSLPIGGGAVGVHCRAITKANVDEFRNQLRQRLDTI